MNDLMNFIKEKLTVPKELIAVYVVIYFLWGVLMHNFGDAVEIARFKYWWQIISCYILYMIPLSLLLRGMTWHSQYAYGVVFMGLLEFGGYALGTSIAFENNILDSMFTERNFALAMTLFFGFYIPIGNWGVEKVYGMIRKK
jgi:hypothetical protein